ncbi:ribosomal RNA small subunit methyltransferase A [Candidatus Marinamargulisbacteria bacterium SCGC AG-343-D04]|nr:ribosomal RNA small subunit methyltransferase A [Candidatus Marinamargulisbacteria bacterium SCGC AG-343-D04]
MRRPKLGQVFLVDQNIIRNIIDRTDLSSSDLVVEIGCGDGILTEALVSKVKQLTVIELDPVCIEKTRDRLGVSDDIEWIHKDVLKVDFSLLQSPLRVVANIPYYLSSKLIQQFVRYKSCFRDMTIMVQKEFALKCIAKPGQKEYTSLSVYTQSHFDIDVLFDISKRCFQPVPKVDSTMIRLRPQHKYDLLNLPFFELIVKASFWGKRKKIQTALLKNPFVSFDQRLKELSFIVEYGHKRADQLSLDDYVELYKQLEFVYHK